MEPTLRRITFSCKGIDSPQTEQHGAASRYGVTVAVQSRSSSCANVWVRGRLVAREQS